jgi:hypothetical protein
MSEVDYDSKSVVELRDECRERGLKTSGNKDELVGRLELADLEGDEEVKEFEAEEDATSTPSTDVDEGEADEGESEEGVDYGPGTPGAGVEVVAEGDGDEGPDLGPGDEGVDYGPGTPGAGLVDEEGDGEKSDEVKQAEQDQLEKLRETAPPAVHRAEEPSVIAAERAGGQAVKAVKGRSRDSFGYAVMGDGRKVPLED